MYVYHKDYMHNIYCTYMCINYGWKIFTLRFNSKVDHTQMNIENLAEKVIKLSNKTDNNLNKNIYLYIYVHTHSFAITIHSL